MKKTILIQKMTKIQQSSTSLYSAEIDGRKREFMIVTSENTTFGTKEISIKEIKDDETKSTIKKTDPLFARILEEIRQPKKD